MKLNEVQISGNIIEVHWWVVLILQICQYYSRDLHIKYNLYKSPGHFLYKKN